MPYGRLMVALLLLQGLSGCHSVRATVGLGVGVGGDVQLSGLVHGGLIVGSFWEAGWSYGRKPTVGSYFSLVLFHYQEDAFKHVESWHMCLGVLPGVWRWVGHNEHPWALEIGVALGFVALRLGWDPVAGVAGMVRVKTGALPQSAPDPEVFGGMAPVSDGIREEKKRAADGAGH